MNAVACLRLAWIAAVAVITLTAAPAAAANSELFPRPAGIEPAVQFWTRVYTEVNTRSGFIHDNLHLDVVYATLRYPEGSSQAERQRLRDRELNRYREILNKLGNGTRSGLSEEERRVLALWPAHVSNAELRAAAQRVRFQLGQSDRFRAGLVRAGEWKPYIYQVLAARGLPRELSVLPHVESSFDPTAYSHAGAAGMWQFIRSTGMRYMQIDHIVDERRDPYFSTDAAARLLADNFSLLQSWPVAITAYNHGAGGMRRAVSELGTSDIGVIIRDYNGRAFGFASRNFYPAFLAALDVDSDPERFFGRITPNPARDLVVAPLPGYVGIDTIARVLETTPRALRELNPSLSDLVWSGEKYVPRGFRLRVPARGGLDPAALLAALPAGELFAAQTPDVEHRVRSGETLSQIAQRYRVSVSALMGMNGLSSANFIRAGQVLRLPGHAEAAADAVLASTREVSAQPVVVDGIYVVRPGDSIERIARNLGVAQESLLAANNIANRNRITAGQQLRVPRAAGVEPAISLAEEAALAVLSDSRQSGARESASASAADAARGDDQEQLAGESAPASELARRPTPLVLIAASDPVRYEDAFYDGRHLPEEADAADSPGDAAGELRDAGLAGLYDSSGEDPNALESRQDDLAADPSNYLVAGNHTIEVQPLETLGHFADWLELRTQRLRDLNGMPFERAVVIGQSLRLDFSQVDPATFEQRRKAYHRDLQDAFFSRYHIADVEQHVVRRGESLWVLANRTYSVPVWLLRQYNPELDLDRVQPGTVVNFPRLRPLADGAATGDPSA